ncbi:hypothetical protein AURDEDRAFT_188605 [Auricularia subglabra TFB-10046 SS5]|nr:hypothetical protein AURDEDRAFT_188605 [Auricularia subglabra TFB-10046 SS5]
MNRHDGANKLPVELLSLVFNSLSLGELLISSRVSPYWRTVAFRHRTFWRDVTLAAASPTAIELFQARLDAGSNRSVIVRLYVPPLEFPPDQRSIVFSSVANHLYRIDRLHVELDVSFDEELFLALNRPAPRLDTLDLTIVDENQISDALPVDLFTARAPCLRYVRLTNMRLCAERLPRVFSPIIELHYCFADALSFPTSVFEHCIALETLVIYGGCCTLRTAGEEICAVATDSLKFVEVAISEGSSDLMQRLPCASIPKVTVALHDQQSVYDLLGHLRGRVDLRIEMPPKSKNMYLHYDALDTGTQRTFLCSPSQITTSYLPPACVAEDLMARVQTLQVTSRCTNLLPAFSELAACTRVSFSLEIEDGLPLAPPHAPLSMPKLERVEISSPSPRALDVGELARFLDATIIPGTEVVQVALTGVALDGDLDPFSHSRFVLLSVAST